MGQLEKPLDAVFVVADAGATRTQILASIAVPLMVADQYGTGEGGRL